MDEAVRIFDVGANPAQLESLVLVKHSGTPRLLIEFLTLGGRSIASGAASLIGEITIGTTAKTLRAFWEDASLTWPSGVEGVNGWLVDGSVRLSRGGNVKATDASPRVPAAGAPMLGSTLIGPGRLQLGRVSGLAVLPEIVQAPPLWVYSMIAGGPGVTMSGVFLNLYGRQVGQVMPARTIANGAATTLWAAQVNDTNRNNSGYTLGTGASERYNPEVVAFEGKIVGGDIYLGRNGLPDGTLETGASWSPTVASSRQIAAGTILLGRFGT